ncbi:MAG: hypothetical protein HS115_04750 [Spirochaetales bacterium]|nr:hypothetical protein [Spirochaetales bacterium]
MKRMKLAALACALLMSGSILAQSKRINRKTEAEKYPELQATEKRQELNVKEVMERLGKFGHLVELTRQDRVNAFRETQEPNKFSHTFRSVKFTPRNTYVRFVSNSDKLSLVGLGNEQELLKELDERVKLANGVGVPVKNLQFAPMDGIEITHFDFIYQNDGFERRAVGSTRKSLTLYFKPAGAGPDNEPVFNLEMAITRIVNDHLRDGVKDVEVVVDPSPLTEDMDDIVVFHRYNQKPTDIVLVGTMSNTPNDPHRTQFKQKFYFKVLDHFYRLMTMVNDYAAREGNDVNRSQLDRLDRSLSY